MIAKLAVKLPFSLLLPEGEVYTLRAYEDSGYSVQIGIPAASALSDTDTTAPKFFIDDKAAFRADVLPIVFTKDAFDRAVGSTVDPPVEVIQRAIDAFVVRLKYVARTPQVTSVVFGKTAWHLDYLSDDGAELEKTEGLLRGRGSRTFSASWIVCDSQLWEHIHALPPDFAAPEWHILITDAAGALPHVGSAVVLAATALEAFVAQVLDRLAAEDPAKAILWHWINGRENPQNGPTVDEQFSSLLSIFCGKSLKRDALDLWEQYKRLKKARNSFVHTGTAEIGGAAVTEEQAAQFVRLAVQITERVSEWLPDNLRWPSFVHTPVVRWEQLIAAPEEPPGAP